MKRIICVGNRLIAQDRGGPAVFDRLADETLPDGVELIDGGLGGLDLLRFVEGAERVVFVDCVAGSGTHDGVVVLDRETAASCCDETHFHHGAGLPYLLRILPRVIDGEVPPISVVGVDVQSDPRAIERAATMCLRLVATDQLHGTRGLCRAGGAP